MGDLICTLKCLHFWDVSVVESSGSQTSVCRTTVEWVNTVDSQIHLQRFQHRRSGKGRRSLHFKCILWKILMWVAHGSCSTQAVVSPCTSEAFTHLFYLHSGSMQVSHLQPLLCNPILSDFQERCSRILPVLDCGLANSPSPTLSCRKMELWMASISL